MRGGRLSRQRSCRPAHGPRVRVCLCTYMCICIYMQLCVFSASGRVPPPGDSRADEMRLGDLQAQQLDATAFTAELSSTIRTSNQTRRARFNPHCGLPAWNNSLAYNRQVGPGEKLPAPLHRPAHAPRRPCMQLQRLSWHTSGRVDLCAATSILGLMTLASETAGGPPGRHHTPVARRGPACLLFPCCACTERAARSSSRAQVGYTRLCLYGARSFAIMNAANGTLVYDSGSAIETAIKNSPVASQCFNCDRGSNTAESRSDDLGAEPEGAARAPAKAAS